MDEAALPDRGRLALRRFASGDAFLAHASPFLLCHEAAHNLLLGIGAALGAERDRAEAAPYLATVERDGAVVAAALMTPPHNLILSLTDAPGAVEMIAADVHAWSPAVPGVLAPKAVGRAFADRWQKLSGEAYCLAMAQRIYQLDAVTPVRGVPGELRSVTAADRDLLLAWGRAFAVEAEGETDPRSTDRAIEAQLSAVPRGVHLWHDGRPVAMVGRGGATPNGIRVGRVYTPPEHRRRGYGSAAVAALSQRLLDTGWRACYLFTDLANPTSNRIYQAIGYRPVCDVDLYRFVSLAATRASPA